MSEINLDFERFERFFENPYNLYNIGHIKVEFREFRNPANETLIWIARIVELQKSFRMISNSNQFSEN